MPISKKKVAAEAQEVKEPVVDNTTATDETEAVETPIEEETKVEEPVAEEKEIPANVEKLMKLNPQYETFYVTTTGFVHPVGAPKYLIKDAILYKNKYFK